MKILPIDNNNKNSYKSSFFALTKVKMSGAFNPDKNKGCAEVYKTFNESSLIKKICDKYKQVVATFSYNSKVPYSEGGMQNGKCTIDIVCWNPAKVARLGEPLECMEMDIDNYDTFEHVKTQLNGADNILAPLLKE